MRITMKILGVMLALLSVSIFISCCTVSKFPAAQQPSSQAKGQIDWPKWQPYTITSKSFATIAASGAEVVTFGPRPDAEEEFFVFGKLENNPENGSALGTFSIDSPNSKESGELNRLTNPNGSHHIFSLNKTRSTKFYVRPATTTPIKGTFVYCTSIMLFSAPERSFVKRLRALGWNVLVILPTDSVFTIPVPLFHNNERDQKKSAANIAKITDSTVAHHLQATRVALAYLADSRPEWSKGKQVLAGGSAGTFALPALAAGDLHWDAVIPIAGTAGMLDAFAVDAVGVATATYAMISFVRETKAEELKKAGVELPTIHEIDQIIAAASSEVQFGSLRLGPHIPASTKFLQIDARFDRTIPREQSNTLHQRLGKPERWFYPVGHGILFYLLPSKAKAIDQWITENT